jgi:hypothetical protein
MFQGQNFSVYYVICILFCSLGYKIHNFLTVATRQLLQQDLAYAKASSVKMVLSLYYHFRISRTVTLIPFGHKSQFCSHIQMKILNPNYRHDYVLTE